jgi:tetratricopeptide (TPR) repeat protein
VTLTFQLTQLLAQVEALMRAGNLPEAKRASRAAVERGASHPNLFILAGLYEIDAGAPDKALVFAQRARALKPRSAEAAMVLGLALAHLGRHREAIAAYDESLRYQPGDPALHFNKGLALEEIHEWPRAKREYERAVELDPQHAEALALLASLNAADGDAKKAGEYAQRSYRLKPGLPAAIVALAQWELNEGRFDAVLAKAAPLAGDARARPVNRSIAEGLVADALDGLGRHAEAFAHYARSNALFKEFYRPSFERSGLERMLARARRMGAYFGTADLTRWRNCDAGLYRAPVETHVFLVGFPRSGTTLLEQVLAAHPDVESLEERDSLAGAMAEFILPPDGLHRLAALDGDALSRFRDAYWSEARAAGVKLNRQVFIDKLPLNALNWGLIAKLFPNARMLFALRDPRDVVLSCFRRRFRISSFMYELLSLDTAAGFYAATMELCEFCRHNLTLETFASRYEDLVADFEPHVRGLCGFLGIEYDEAMKDFAGKTRSRMIRTPSQAQVARGLYSSGRGQWRAYRDQLAPVMPVLASWIPRFGYDGS